MKQKIMIVDDHPIVRRGLRELARDELDLEVCGEAATFDEALQLLDHVRPDLVIVDLSLKQGHGLELTKEILARDKTIKVLVSSMHDELLFAERSLRCGALGYISKQEPPSQMAKAIRTVLRGEVYVSSDVDALLLRRLSAGHSLQGDPIESLTNRELEIFGLIGQGLSVKQIAQRLGVSNKTVEAHRDRIKGKLNVGSSLEVSRRAMQWTLEGN